MLRKIYINLRTAAFVTTVMFNNSYFYIRKKISRNLLILNSFSPKDWADTSDTPKCEYAAALHFRYSVQGFSLTKT